MQVSTRGRYAVMALIDLIELQQGGEAVQPVPLQILAVRQNISLSYLEQLFSRLRKAGIVRSVRGPGGGYVISADPHNLPLREVVLAVDGRKRGNTHHLWNALGRHVEQFFSDVTLGMVMDAHYGPYAPEEDNLAVS